MSQRTSQFKPISDGLAREIGRMHEDAARKFDGGTFGIELVKGDPEFQESLFKHWQQRVALRARLLPLIERPPLFSLELGLWKSKDGMISAVESAGSKFSDWALQVIGNPEFTLLPEPGVYDFVPSDVGELTGKNQVKTPELYVAQSRLGFIESPHESACSVRIAYSDQPMNEWRVLLSKPVADAYGDLSVLRVDRRGDGSWVSGGFADPGRVWGGDERLLLCRKHPLAA